MGTRLFLRSTTASPAPTLGEKSTALPLGTATLNSGATFESLSLSVNKGASEVTRTIASKAQTTQQSMYIARFSSVPLVAQTIPAGNWKYGLETAETNAAANTFLSLAIYIWRPSTNAVVQTIYDSSTKVGTEWGASGLALVGTVAGSAATVQANDILVVEIWGNSVQAMATSYTQTLYFDGLNAPTTNGVSITSAASYIEAPSAVIPAPLIATLTDSFTGTTVDTSKWIVNQVSGGTVAQVGDRLHLTPSTGTSYTAATILSATDYDLTNGSIYIKYLQRVGSTSGTESSFEIRDSVEGTNISFGFWDDSGDGLHAQFRNFGTNEFNEHFTTLVHPTDYAWLRLRHSGSTMFWDTAPSTASNPPLESEWVNRASYTTSVFDPGRVKAVVNSNTFTTQSSVGTGIFDGFNTAANLEQPPVIGTLTYTEAADTGAAGGAALVKGTLTSTEVGDSVAADGVVSLIATATITEGSDTLGSASKVDIVANSTLTESGDTLASSATPVIPPANADLVYTEAGDTVSSSAVVAFAPAIATATITESGDTLTSSSAVPVAASLTRTEVGDSVASGATVALRATSSLTETGDSVGSSGAVGVRTSSNITESGDTASSGATVLLAASLSRTEAGDTATSQASNAIAASSSIVEQGDSVSSSGLAIVSATSSMTEQADTMYASVADGTSFASANLTESPDTASISVNAVVGTSLTVSEQSDGVASSGSVGVSTNATIGEGADTTSSSASVAVGGTLAATEQPDTVNGYIGGIPPVVASLSSQEAPDSVASVLNVSVTASGSVVELGDTVTAATSNAVSINAVANEASDSCTALVEVLVQAETFAQEVADTVSALVAQVIEASLESEEMGDTVSSNADVRTPQAYYLDPDRAVHVEAYNRKDLVPKEVRQLEVEAREKVVVQKAIRFTPLEEEERHYVINR